ncbi:hypothetical protein NIA69_11165 [Gemmiger formicilis]|nr:hypothetical protein [Gemmiger formicilis]
MTEDQMCAAFEHCDPARYQEFYKAVRELAARPDINLRREVQFCCWLPTRAPACTGRA